MTEQTFPLITFYKGWKTWQQSLVEIIAPLSPEQLAFPASAHHWSIGMIAQHIVGSRVWWFQVWMGEGNPELAPLAHWDPQDKEQQLTLSASELVTGLERTWQMIADALALWTPADLEHVFPCPASLSEEERRIFPELTRQWIIWHVLEHEIHHGGELSLALGNLQLDGIYGNA
jgi:uncharacterized damage-inducible protein DinB